MTIEEKREKCAALAHAMQTGVAYKMPKDSSDTEPKHLRVGINMAMIEHAALAGLLMRKGIITEDEYLDSLIVELEREVDLYQQEISQLYGASNFTLA